MATIQTVLHTYCYNINTPEGAAGYAALCDARKADGVKLFDSISAGRERGDYADKIRAFNGKPVTLELKHIFDNQWNTAEGLRVFDWSGDIDPSIRHIKRGHWLEMTEAMRAIRHDRHKCGYCGYECAQADAAPFCPNCLDSEYLTADQLPLTRMLAVSSKARRAALTPEELAERLPLFKAAQIHGSTARGKARLAKLRADTIKKRDEAIANANTEHDGMMWLIDRGITESAIYYLHTGRFGFGWSRPVQAVMLDDLRAALAGFPFAYDIKEATK